MTKYHVGDVVWLTAEWFIDTYPYPEKILGIIIEISGTLTRVAIGRTQNSDSLFKNFLSPLERKQFEVWQWVGPPSRYVIELENSICKF